MEMNVMMIGFSGTGKTSYMGAMYKMFSSGRGRAGFTIKAWRNEDHEHFVGIGNLLDEGKYPSSSDVMSDYRFDLRYRGRKILDFNWKDYRGGILANSTDEEFKTVVDSIIAADALIVFLDAKIFSARQNKVAERIFGRIFNLIQNTMVEKKGYIPISFVITKWDLLSGRYMSSKAWENLEYVKDLIRENDSISGMLTGTIVGTKCQNIEYPFLYSMWKALIMRYNDIVLNHNSTVGCRNQYAENIGFVDDVCTGVHNFFATLLDGTPVLSNRQKTAMLDSTLQSFKNEMDELQRGPLKKIEAIFKHSNDFVELF